MGIAATIIRSFHGGVHPPENKDIAGQCAIEPMPLPEKLYVPLHQHIGAPCDPSVKPGTPVKKGTQIGKPGGFVSAPVHAPTSGIITDIVEHPVGHPSGLTMLCAVLEPDGKDEWDPSLSGIENPFEADPAAIRDKIRAAGIVGLGGATFPSFIKLSPPKDKPVELLLINGVECEPYLTCDARLMEERAAEIVDGCEIMRHALQTKMCIIGIENNKPAAIQAMQKAITGKSDMRVDVLPVMYPQGGEKQLIEVVTGKQVPSGGLPIAVGVIVHNVGTAYAIRDAVRFGRPLVSRLVTMTGKGISRPANLEVAIGVPVQALIDHCGGLKPGVKKIINGGPMMGVALKYLETPVVKGTSGIIAMLEEETFDRPEHPCIRCGHCLQACPISLMPTEMAWLARHDQFEKLAEYHLFDCIECGSCSYVCPSNIPLVHYFRYGKMAIQFNDREKKRGELAKKRTQAKEERTAREQAERERKKAEMKAQMAAKRKAAAAAKTSDDAAEKIPSAPKSAQAGAEGAAGDDRAAKAKRAAAAARAAKAKRAAAAARTAKATE
jgi:electron transport complex protein RnfC